MLVNIIMKAYEDREIQHETNIFKSSLRKSARYNRSTWVLTGPPNTGFLVNYGLNGPRRDGPFRFLAAYIKIEINRLIGLVQNDRSQRAIRINK